MKRLARLAVVAGLGAALVMPARQATLATPFSDVPANHWAYQYIQSLAADGIIDGYPDGKFKGDRPLTRYEMAVVVARVIAKLQENQGPKGASKEDLDKLQKLIDSLKDELDALGVRVTNLEDSLDALDKRTKFAQSLSMHGVFLPNITLRERPGAETSITNTTGAAVTTYYGAAIPCSPGNANGCPLPAAGTVGNPTAVGAPDPFVNAYLATDDSNNPLYQASSGIQIRQDSRFSLAYQVNDNLTVSLPVHILNFEYGGDFSQQAKVDIEPTIDIAIAKAGALSNLDFKFGVIDNMTSSRTGLAFRAPQGYNGAVPYEEPYQPPQKGMAIKGTIGEGAFGMTDVEASFTRMDDVRLDTQTGVTDPNTLPISSNAYFFPVVAPQEGYTQTTPAGTLTTNTFNAGAGALDQVFLTQSAVNGSVYISYYNGATYNNKGTQTGGPATTVPGFTFNAAYNSVVFTDPLPAGSVVGITYKGLGTTNNTSFQRYMIHTRLNQKFKGYTGAEVGMTFNRIFDYDDTETVGIGSSGFTNVNQASPDGYGLVSDTVFGLDFQAPIPYNIWGAGSSPVIFGEFADSKYTPDYRNIAAVGDTAGIVGLKLTVDKILFTGQYQSVGQDFFVGAPLRYFGNAPYLIADYKGFYLPDFFGFGNDVGINQQFDNQFTSAGLTSLDTAGNPNLTFAYPIYNMLKASGPTYFSAFAPNSRGPSLSVNAPIRVGGMVFTTTASYQHLSEIRPDGMGALLYGPSYASNKTETYDTYGLNTKFSLPVFGNSATINLNGSYETLQRLDMTAEQYYPINPTTQTFDATSFAAAAAAFPGGGTYGGGSLVSFYPNYINMRHITIGANAVLPLTKELNLNGAYSTQHYGGAYGTTLGQNISEHKDYYLGGLTYNIPKTNSSLSFTARHYGYFDAVVPNFNFSQNRQDVNFTVRF
jgi:hypothetical protein